MRNLKQSNISCMGKIPSDWKTCRIKHVFSVTLGKMLSPEKTEAEQSLENYLCSANIKWSGIDSSINKKMWFSENEKKQYLLREGDVLIMEGGLAGTSSIYHGELAPCYIQNSVHKCCGHNVYENKYLYYWMSAIQSSGYIDSICNKATIQHYTKDKVKETPFVCISEDEQRAIVTYLDNKCAAIDEAIERHKKIIEKLEEYRTSEISTVVTIGLNPDVKMKLSGSKCTEMIPYHWKYCKILYVLSMPITDGPHETPIAMDDGIPFISAEAVSQGNGKINFNHMWGFISQEFYEQCCKKYIPQINDIYMIKSGATTGKIAIVDTERKFTIWSPLAVLRSNSEVMLPKFLFYYLQSNGYQQQVELGWNYGTQQNIGMRMVERLKVCVPPLDEQNAIIKHLDDKWDKINRAIEKENTLISKLEEYRKSIIYNAVTGKIDCREGTK